VNELEFIRHQVSTERSHMAEVRGACAAALAQGDGAPDLHFIEACASYLVFVVDRFNAQDQAHCELLRPRLDPADSAARAAIDDLLQALAASRDAIDALRTALAARQAGRLAEPQFIAAVRDYLAVYSAVLATRRHSIHHLFERHYGIVEWRRASAVDADSILEERERHARVLASLPDGITLARSTVEAPSGMRREASAESQATRPPQEQHGA
jgi:hypothetical protein